MRSRLEIVPSARRVYRTLPARLRSEILDVLADLTLDPYLGEPLQRELVGRYKIRVDGYRIIYKVDEDRNVILILAIKPRGRNTYINLP
ncbi:MAG: type II toxin-antitoxin system RelE/ParE family toxin [Caldilineaceae bacterium]|nr:type II toxin-antitoxin system RelE/ParE family toxin [Caldilineaceae bacterium]MCB9158302.1 type II toxin-antitoxin system RelE/ParE family toxin [Caldilineaceae bacterium]